MKSLKMIGLYLDTLILGHTFCNMLSIINELILHKKLQIFVTNNVYWTNKVKTQQQNKNIKITVRAK